MYPRNTKHAHTHGKKRELFCLLWPASQKSPEMAGSSSAVVIISLFNPKISGLIKNICGPFKFEKGSRNVHDGVMV